jgi:cell division protein FtsB
LHAGRLAVLALVLIAAAFYVQPLRAFFAQQDRYLAEAVMLDRARADNLVLKQQVARLQTRDYITRQAREEFQLAPPGMQVFVVKGLPEGHGELDELGERPPASTPSLGERLRDLWQTLRR